MPDFYCRLKNENSGSLLTEYDRLVEGLKQAEEARATDQIQASPGEFFDFSKVSAVKTCAAVLECILTLFFALEIVLARINVGNGVPDPGYRFF